MRIFDRQVLSLLHRILGRVLPENANDVDGDLDYQLMRAQHPRGRLRGRVLVRGRRIQHRAFEAGLPAACWTSCRCSGPSPTASTTSRRTGAPVDDELALELEFQGFDHNDPLEGHMASYVTS